LELSSDVDEKLDQRQKKKVHGHHHKKSQAEARDSSLFVGASQQCFLWALA
jgi:hypothetical protein